MGIIENLYDEFEAGKKDLLYFDVILKNSNISVREILRQLSMGISINDIVKSEPNITSDDIFKCLSYAFELIGAIDFETAAPAINDVMLRRKEISDKLDTMGTDPSQFKKYFD